MAHIITIGNEKGGTGKSTLALHIFAAAAHSGYQVGIIDLDLRQLSLERFMSNRRQTTTLTGVTLPMPLIHKLPESQQDSRAAMMDEEIEHFDDAIGKLDESCDLVLIDCPGANTHYARMAHSVADTLLTPMNESFVDFDMLAHIDANRDHIAGPSRYSDAVASARKLRQENDLDDIDWIVVRNRMSLTDQINRARVSEKLDALATRLSFRHIDGFSERVIFRALFSKGLTLLDLPIIGRDVAALPNLDALSEYRALMAALNLDEFEFQI